MEFNQGLNMVLRMLVAGIVLHVTADDRYIDPSVRLVSCLTGKIVLKIRDSQADGVMYIKDRDTAYNMQFTDNGTMVYSCGFVECNLAWNTPFTFVIQRKVEIQTLHDVKLIFTCVWDQSDIVPDDGTNKNSDSGNTQFYIYTARASMNFYNDDGGHIVTGSYIKLGSNVTMEIKLVNTHDDLLDINVKSCEAAGIGIITERCPLDEDLFDTFNKTSVGVIENIFQMFRTTSSNPEPVSMFFSCLLEVCYAPCIKYYCNGTVAIPESSRRKRRESQEPGQVAKSMIVGSLFKVGLEDPVIVIKGKPGNCVAIHVYIATIALFGFLLFLSLSAMLYYWHEWKKIKDKLTAKCEAADRAQELFHEASKLALNQTDSKGIELKVLTSPENKVNSTKPSKVTREQVKNTVLSVTMESKKKEVVVEKSCVMNKANFSSGKSLNQVTYTSSNTAPQQKVFTDPGKSIILHRISSSNNESSRPSKSEKPKDIPTIPIQVESEKAKDKSALQYQVEGTKFKDKTTLPVSQTQAIGTSLLSPDVGTNKTKPPAVKPAKKVSFLLDNDTSATCRSVVENTNESRTNTADKVTDRETTVRQKPQTAVQQKVTETAQSIAPKPQINSVELPSSTIPCKEVDFSIHPEICRDATPLDRVKDIGIKLLPTNLVTKNSIKQ